MKKYIVWNSPISMYQIPRLYEMTIEAENEEDAKKNFQNKFNVGTTFSKLNIELV